MPQDLPYYREARLPGTEEWVKVCALCGCVVMDTPAHDKACVGILCGKPEA